MLKETILDHRMTDTINIQDHSTLSKPKKQGGCFILKVALRKSFSTDKEAIDEQPWIEKSGIFSFRYGEVFTIIKHKYLNITFGNKAGINL